MVKLTTNRGTAVQNINATFGKFTQEAQKLQKERLDVSGADTVLSVQRGTATIQAKDIPAVSQPSLKGQKITTNRGTSTLPSKLLFFKNSPNTIRFIRNTVTLYEMRKIPRPFKMPWGKGMVIDEVSISSQYHEPTIQLLEFDNGDKLLRFCSYSHGRFSRSPLMIDEKDLRRLGKAIVKGKEIRKFVSKLNQ